MSQEPTRLEDRKTVEDQMLKASIEKVLSQNMDNKLTPALLVGLSEQLFYLVANSLKATSIPQDVIDYIYELEEKANG